MAIDGHGPAGAGEPRDRRMALCAMLVLHAVGVGWLATRPVAPAPVADAGDALQVVFVDAPPARGADAVPSLPVPPRAPAAPRRSDAVPRDARPSPMRSDAGPTAIVAPDAGAAVAAPDAIAPAPPASPGVADDAGDAPAASAPRFVRDALGGRPPDLVAAPTRVRLRMQPPPSPQRRLQQLAAFIAPAGYEADPCPRIGRNLAALASDGSDAGRAGMAEELRRRAQLCE